MWQDVTTARTCLVISLDVSGQFDGTWHPSILQSLKKSNCHLNYVHLIHIFLNERHVPLEASDITETKSLLCLACSERYTSFLWNIDFNNKLNPILTN